MTVGARHGKIWGGANRGIGFGAMTNGGLGALPKLLGIHDPLSPYRALSYCHNLGCP